VNPGARRNAAIATGGVLAFVALIVPQITGALNLMTLGKLLAVTGVALLTAIAQRLSKCVRDRQTVRDALRVWPPEPLGSARLETLGVYPARNANGVSTRYQPRPDGEDDTLADALRTAQNVIVHGPRLCGKSRATAQAARRALEDIPAVIPLDAQSLRSLLEGGIDPSDTHTPICLWLDGLDRFVEALDPPSIATLAQESKPQVRIVGTVRTEQWTELIEGSGQPTEAARALAQNARVVPLKHFSPPNPDEPAREPAATRVQRPKPLWQDGVLGLLVAGLLALLLIGGIFNGDLLTPRSIGDQMDELKGHILEEGHGGSHVVIDERVWFHPADAPSWLLVVEDFPNHDEFYAGAANGAQPQPRSDDLRIYDVVNGQLRLKLHFRPAGIGSKAAEWRVLGAGAASSTDYDEDGAPEVIAGYALPSEATEALLPFGIDWEGHYRLVSLTPHKPRLGTYGLDARTRRFRREAYETPITLRTAVSEPGFGGLQLKGYRVQAFALAQKPAPRLLTGYFAAFPEYAKTEVLEIHASQFRTGQLEIQPCTTGYYACPAPKAVQDALIPPEKTVDEGLLEAWETVGGRWTTPVRVVQRQGQPQPAAATHRRGSPRSAPIGRERAGEHRQGLPQ
jgi:hypothetical protein